MGNPFRTITEPSRLETDDADLEHVQEASTSTSCRLYLSVVRVHFDHVSLTLYLPCDVCCTFSIAFSIREALSCCGNCFQVPPCFTAWWLNFWPRGVAQHCVKYEIHVFKEFFLKIQIAVLAFEYEKQSYRLVEPQKVNHRVSSWVHEILTYFKIISLVHAAVNL